MYEANLAYRTEAGEAWCGDALELLSLLPDESVNLVVTSPPFALQRQKSYGNMDQADYVDWLCKFGKLVRFDPKRIAQWLIDQGFDPL